MASACTCSRSLPARRPWRGPAAAPALAPLPRDDLGGRPRRRPPVAAGPRVRGHGTAGPRGPAPSPCRAATVDCARRVAQPSFVLRASVRRERPEEPAKPVLLPLRRRGRSADRRRAASCSARATSRSPARPSASVGLDRTTSTDRRGRFRLDGVPGSPVDSRLRVRAKGVEVIVPVPAEPGSRVVNGHPSGPAGGRTWSNCSRLTSTSRRCPRDPGRSRPSGRGPPASSGSRPRPTPTAARRPRSTTGSSSCASSPSRKQREHAALERRVRLLPERRQPLLRRQHPPRRRTSTPALRRARARGRDRDRGRARLHRCRRRTTRCSRTARACAIASRSSTGRSRSTTSSTLDHGRRPRSRAEHAGQGRPATTPPDEKPGLRPRAVGRRLRGVLLPGHHDPRPAQRRARRRRAVRAHRRHLGPHRRDPRRPQGAGQRARPRRAQRHLAADPRRAGRAQPGRRQLHPLLRRARASGSGARGRWPTRASEWRYLNVRRLFNMIEESIAEATRWIVFEPNDRALWKSIRRDVGAFLTRVWRDGALMGRTAERGVLRQVRRGDQPARGHRRRDGGRDHRHRAGEARRVRRLPDQPARRRRGDRDGGRLRWLRQQQTPPEGDRAGSGDARASWIDPYRPTTSSSSSRA